MKTKPEISKVSTKEDIYIENSRDVKVSPMTKIAYPMGPLWGKMCVHTHTHTYSTIYMFIYEWYIIHAKV